MGREVRCSISPDCCFKTKSLEAKTGDLEARSDAEFDIYFIYYFNYFVITFITELGCIPDKDSESQISNPQAPRYIQNLD